VFGQEIEKRRGKTTKNTWTCRHS